MDQNQLTRFLAQVISTNGQIRSQYLLQKLQETGVETRISEGVLLSEKDFKENLYHNSLISRLICQRKLSRGEIGCALAHKNAASDTLTENYNFFLVFEDDAEIVNRLDFDVIQSALDSPEPRILILGWIPGYAIAAKPKANESKSYFDLITPTTCAFSYAYNKAASREIESKNLKIIDVADWPIYLFNKVSFKIVSKPWVIASQNPSNSIIGIREKIRSNSEFEKVFSKFRILISITLVFLYFFKHKPRIKFNQIIHRMIVKDWLYRYGLTHLNNNENQFKTENIVFLDNNLQRFFKILRVIN